MRRLLILLMSLFLLSFTARSQELSWSTDGQLTYEQTDLDARVNWPVMDRNNKLCALIKVTVTNGKLESPLVLRLGSILEVVSREEKPEYGEVWFYVPVEVKNLEFLCAGYRPIMVPVTTQLQQGGVYRVTIASESSGTYVRYDPVKSNYLKIRVPEGTLFSIGRTRDYEISSDIISNGEFSMRLDYGEYYYKAENELYETAEGTLAVDDNSEMRTIEMTPAYSYLDIETEPGGADVFVDGKSVGTSPVSLPDKVKRGSVSIRVQKEMYCTEEITFNISGDALRHTATVTLSPQFGTVVCRCEDPEAELWIDNQKVGAGTWTGQLSSRSSHYLEARKKGHLSRSVNFDVVEGGTVTQTIGSPEPLYGSIEVLSEPSGAVVKVDGKQVGTTPFILNEVLTEDHRIELYKDGYELHIAAFTLDHNQHLSLKYTLKKEEVKVTPLRQEATANMETGTLNGYEWVDLGLSVLWATCNVGASSPSDYGNYYAWGETTTKSRYTESNSRTYEVSMGDISGNPQYDAATANWGDGWRMPTEAEFEELVDKCDWQWTSQGGRNGYKVTGPNDNSIFLPAAGWRLGTSLYLVGEDGSYWSSSPNGGVTQDAYDLLFYSGYHRVYWGDRDSGFSVRPVSDKMMKMLKDARERLEKIRRSASDESTNSVPEFGF